jgi:hypothetical protein
MSHAKLTDAFCAAEGVNASRSRTFRLMVSAEDEGLRDVFAAVACRESATWLEKEFCEREICVADVTGGAPTEKHWPIQLCNLK